MEFTKITKEIFDPIKENKEKFSAVFGAKLVEMFPSVLKDGEIDFQALFSEFGTYANINERYEFNWAGKTEAKRSANTDIVGKTLKYVPKDSKNADTTENLYIEGDNLEVLKLLRNSYYNKIKMIYIDPPYNTGKDFVYKDNFSASEKETSMAENDIDNEGNRLIVNQKSDGKYHTNWLNMMYPRLKVAKDLLTDEGVAFISIDDNEVSNLRKLCDEIFGEECFVADICVVNNLKGRNDKKYIATANERLLMYVKSEAFNEYGLGLSEQMIGEYKEEDDGGSYRLIELRKRGGPDTRKERPNMYYPFYINSSTGIVSLEKDDLHQTEVLPVKSNGEDGRWRWGKDTAGRYSSLLVGKPVQKSNRYNIYEKDYLENDGKERRIRPKSVMAGAAYSTDGATKAYRSLMGSIEFNNPKPVPFIQDLVTYSSSPNSSAIILDFFSGSATTAHAVMQVNAEDGGNRKVIMVQIPEPCDENSEAFKASYENICEIGKERIRRAGEKIKEENKCKEGIENLDIGFKVFKVAETNIRWFSDALKSNTMTLDESMMSDKDKLDFNPDYADIDVVYEILLRHREIPLSTNVEQLSNIGTRTYIFADTAVVCLEENITDEIIDKIVEIEPLPTKIIFRDSAFNADISLKENAMLRLEADMKKHSGLAKKAYRVEFI